MRYIFLLLTSLCFAQAPTDFNPIDVSTRIYFTATAGVVGDSVWHNQASGAPDSVIQATASARPTLVGDSVFTFDGGDFFYSLQDVGNFTANSAFTIEYWGKVGTAFGSTNNVIIGKRRATADLWYFYIVNSYVRLYMVDNATTPNHIIDARTDGTPISDGVEYHLVVAVPATRDTAHFYINGVAVATTVAADSSGAFNITGEELGVGARDNTGALPMSANSTMRMVAIHDVERDAAWVSNHYQYLQGNIATAQQQQATTKWLGFGSWLGW